MMRVKKTEALFLVDLVRSGLRGEAPSGVPSRIDWNRLFDLAAWNSVTGLTWRSVRLVEEVPDDAREKWENSARVTALRKTLYDVEREQVIAELTRRGVSVMPVKGAVIADLYPDAGMRSMADNDVVYGFVERRDDGVWVAQGGSPEARREAAERARLIVLKVMGELGYVPLEVLPLETSHDVRFDKPPCLCFEMHHALLNSWYSDPGLLSNPWESSRPIAGSSRGESIGQVMQRDREMEYAHFVVHAFKHLTSGGFGLRVLADECVLLDAWNQSMDWGRVAEALHTAGAERFGKDLRALATRAVHGCFTRADDAWIWRMVREGTYGIKVKKAYDIKARSLAGRMGLDDVTQLPLRPLSYVGNGVVSRPLMPLYSAVWGLHMRAKGHEGI